MVSDFNHIDLGTFDWNTIEPSTTYVLGSDIQSEIYKISQTNCKPLYVTLTALVAEANCKFSIMMNPVITGDLTFYIGVSYLEVPVAVILAVEETGASIMLTPIFS